MRTFARDMAVKRKSKPKSRDQRIPFGYGVFAVMRDGKARAIELRDVPWMVRTLGRPIAAGMLRCFNAAERIAALVHLASMNTAHGGKGAAHQRNFLRVFFLLADDLDIRWF